MAKQNKIIHKIQAEALKVEIDNLMTGIIEQGDGNNKGSNNKGSNNKGSNKSSKKADKRDQSTASPKKERKS